MAYLDRGISETYVSPQIEAALGFSQEEWLEDPSAGTARFIPTTNGAGVLKQRRCFLPASFTFGLSRGSRDGRK